RVGRDEANRVRQGGDRRQFLPETCGGLGSVPPQFIPRGQTVVAPRRSGVFGGQGRDLRVIAQHDLSLLNLGALLELGIVLEQADDCFEDTRFRLVAVVCEDQNLVRGVLSEGPPYRDRRVDRRLPGLLRTRVDDRLPRKAAI